MVCCNLVCFVGFWVMMVVFFFLMSILWLIFYGLMSWLYFVFFLIVKFVSIFLMIGMNFIFYLFVKRIIWLLLSVFGRKFKIKLILLLFLLLDLVKLVRYVECFLVISWELREGIDFFIKLLVKVMVFWLSGLLLMFGGLNLKLNFLFDVNVELILVYFGCFILFGKL